MISIIELENTYKDYQYLCVGTSMGHRCGYVVLHEQHPLYRVDYNDIYIDCHGGLTYSGDAVAGKKDGWYIGFDCAHSYDKQDIDLINLNTDEDIKRRTLEYMEVCEQFSNDREVRTVEFVENECKNIIDQLHSKQF